MYDEPPGDDRPGCRETLILTRAAFAVVIPVVVAMIAVLSLVMVALLLFVTRPLLALLPVAALIAGIVLYSRWEQGRRGPPRGL